MAAEPQHMVALARAQECQRLRRALKREIKAGEASLSELLSEVDLPVWLHGELICQLVCAMDRVGTLRMRLLLAEQEIPERKPVGKMTYRQRRRLSVELAKWERKSLASGKRTRAHKSRAGLRKSVTLSSPGGEK